MIAFPVYVLRGMRKELLADRSEGGLHIAQSCQHVHMVLTFVVAQNHVAGRCGGDRRSLATTWRKPSQPVCRGPLTDKHNYFNLKGLLLIIVEAESDCTAETRTKHAGTVVGIRTSASIKNVQA